jgi:hypothetical protein
MGKRVGVRTEYFKRSQAKGVMSHNKREFEEDKNVIDKARTKNNFGTKLGVIDAKYEAALAEMNEHTNNVLIDSVLVLPEEQLRVMAKEHPKDWQKKLGEAIKSIMTEIENEQGFVSLGYRVHLDEGSINKDGKVKLNTHAHMMFANHCRKDVVLEKTKRVTQKDENGKAKRDPDNKNKYLYERNEYGQIKTEIEQINLKGRSPLSLMQTRGSDSAWAKQQDIAAKHLSKYGFERGLSKEITNREHKKKSEWVKHQMEEQRAEIMAEINLQVEKTLKAREALLKAFREDHLDDLNKLEDEFLVEFEGIDNEQIRSKILDSSEKAVERMKEDDCAFISTPALNAAENSLKRTREAHKAKSNPTIKPKM